MAHDHRNLQPPQAARLGGWCGCVQPRWAPPVQALGEEQRAQRLAFACLAHGEGHRSPVVLERSNTRVEEGFNPDTPSCSHSWVTGGKTPGRFGRRWSVLDPWSSPFQRLCCGSAELRRG